MGNRYEDQWCPRCMAHTATITMLNGIIGVVECSECGYRVKDIIAFEPKHAQRKRLHDEKVHLNHQGGRNL